MLGGKSCSISFAEGGCDSNQCEVGMCSQVLLFGVGGGVEEAARAPVRCAYAKFKELQYLLSWQLVVHHTT